MSGLRVDRELARPKRTAEKFRIGWDFVDDIASGDTITGQSVTATKVGDGTDASVTLLASPALSGTEVSVLLQAGTDGQDYDVKFIAPTAAGHRFERVVRVQVRD